MLLHPTSLPGPYGSGDLGVHAGYFVDWLKSAGQSIWQMLPLGGVGEGHSPYMSDSAFAGNPALIDLEDLVQQGWLDAVDLQADPAFETRRVLFDVVIPWRLQRMERASQRFAEHSKENSVLAEEFSAFRKRHDHWLADYALFKAISERHAGMAWNEWPRALARREPAALAAARRELRARIDHWCFVQWCFDRQWQRLRKQANDQGISLFGDVPIFVALHSADVWSRPELFQLDEQGRPDAVAGVPPDYFSPTGQRWGNPLYAWASHAAQGYDWWIARMRRVLELVDEVRIDHFRGFAAYWRIPADATDATTGKWIPGPGSEFFATLSRALGRLPV
ncbi:MAG: 4-alpha-glucanotransferase, partial [Gammaproteobacteria bacterium]|nr:4-alpha-glucanotransferase [Gammaproteobacteria bacterium]